MCTHNIFLLIYIVSTGQQKVIGHFEKKMDVRFSTPPHTRFPSLLKKCRPQNISNNFVGVFSTTRYEIDGFMYHSHAYIKGRTCSSSYVKYLATNGTEYFAWIKCFYVNSEKCDSPDSVWMAISHFNVQPSKKYLTMFLIKKETPKWIQASQLIPKRIAFAQSDQCTLLLPLNM